MRSQDGTWKTLTVKERDEAEEPTMELKERLERLDKTRRKVVLWKPREERDAGKKMYPWKDKADTPKFCIEHVRYDMEVDSSDYVLMVEL